MSGTMKKSIFTQVTALIFLAASATAQAGLQEGINAYRYGNFAVALKELKPLAEKGDAKAQWYLGNMYSDGNGVRQSHKKAASLYRKSAEQGHAAAQFSFAVMCERGIGVPKSDKQAASWYHKAAEQGHAEAQYTLGTMYEHGRGAVPKDLVQAYRWFSLAVANGFEMAEDNIAEITPGMSQEQIEQAQTLVRESQPKRP
jgi:TPR repeat protein